MKKYLILLALLCLSCFANERSVIDDAGNKVNLKGEITRVADSWYAHNSLMIALGKGDTIKVTSDAKQTYPWMYKVQPSLNDALLAKGAKFNIEELIAKKIQLAFILTLRNFDAPALKRAGIPTIQVYFHTLDGLKKNMLLTAKAMGGKEALKRANLYNTYLDTQIKRISTITKTLSKKPKVLHINSINPLKIDGKDTLISTWINIAGGVNAAKIKGNSKLVSPESVLSWDPDVIIIGANAAGKLKDSPAYALLKQTKAVKNAKVFINPKGVFLWDRYGVESALQIQWAAKLLHPKLFKNDDLVGITRAFYKQFFSYDLKPDEAKLILKGLPPKN